MEAAEAKALAGMRRHNKSTSKEVSRLLARVAELEERNQTLEWAAAQQKKRQAALGATQSARRTRTTPKDVDDDVRRRSRDAIMASGDSTLSLDARARVSRVGTSRHGVRELRRRRRETTGAIRSIDGRARGVMRTERTKGDRNGTFLLHSRYV